MFYKKRNLRLYKYQWKDIANDINKSINIFRAIYDELKEQGIDVSKRYDIRIYSTIPTTSCAFNDSILNISFYDERVPATMTPVWIFERNDSEGNLYKYYQHNFDVIWQDAISIFDKDFEKKVVQSYEEELKLVSSGIK